MQLFYSNRATNGVDSASAKLMLLHNYYLQTKVLDLLSVHEDQASDPTRAFVRN